MTVKAIECEQFGIESGAEKSAGAVEVGADLMDGRIEPAAFDGIHTGEPVQVGDNQHDTDRPKEVHNLCQRSEIILLLAHKNVIWELKLRSVTLLFLTLHTASEFLSRPD